MTTEANKLPVRKYVDAFNGGDTDRLQTLFSEDSLVYGVLGWGGMDQVVPIWREIKAAFDIQLEIESMIAEGDIVGVRDNASQMRPMGLPLA